MFCCVRGYGGQRAWPPCFRQPVGRRSCFDPCMPGWFGVGRLACGLFMVMSWLLPWFCWCTVVLAASWSACSALVPWRCCRRLHVRCCSCSCPACFRVGWSCPGRAAIGAVLFAWPGLVLCWCVAPLLVGFASLVRGPPHGRACCVGARPPPTVGRVLSVCGPSDGGCCARVVRHSLFLFHGCRRPAAHGPLLACVRRRLLLCPPPPLHPTPPFRLLSPAPPFASWCPAPAGTCPPPPGVCPSRLVVSSSAFTLVACVPCGWPFVGVSFCPPPPSCFLGVGPCRSFSLVLRLLPCFFRAFGLGTCLVGLLFPPSARAGAAPPPPPRRLLLVACGAPRLVLWCCGWVWAVVCGARCFAAPCCVAVRVPCWVVLCCALVCCAVGRLLLVLATPFLLVSPGAPLRRAVLCGVSSCVVPSCVVMCCGVFLVALWCRGCSLSAILVLRTCGFAPPGAAPPPPWFVCRAFCRFVLPRCAGLFYPLWCRVAACCVVLFGVRRAVSCCAVSRCAPRVAWCCAAVPRAAASCCVLCRARWCCAVLSCVAPFAGLLRCGALCCAVPLCAVVGCFVPSGVCWRCAVGCVLCCAVVCCCVLCCAFGRGVWLRCAVLSSLWLAVLFWSRCPVLCCASWCFVGPRRVVLCCVVLCCVVVRCAVRWGAPSWCSVLCCPTLCCCGLLCAVWCPLALCGWLLAVLRCCLLPCVVLRLWAWCLVALCCAVLVVACCFVLVALPCAVLNCASWCCVGPCCVVFCCVVLCCRAPRCGGGTVLRCPAVCGAASCCGVPSGAVRCLGYCVLCCVLCCAAVFCAVPGGVVSWCAVLCCSRRVLLFGRGLCSCVVCCVSWCCGALRCILLFRAV